MGLADAYNDFFNPSTMFGGGDGIADEMNKGYNQAREYLKPYVEGGRQDYDRLRGHLGNKGDMLNQYGNPADWMWRNANQSPTYFYQKMMSGYSQSPQAKYEQEVAMRAANQGASASGMLGSGAYYKGLQENAGGIAQRDMQRYWENMLGASNAQMGYAKNFQGEQSDWERMMQAMSQMGLSAAGGMGGIAIGQGNANSQIERDKQKAFEDALGMAMGAASSGGGMGGGFR